MDRALLGVAALASSYLLAQLLLYGYGRDQAIYALVADGMRQGHAPYRDVWDFKTPGIYFVFAAAQVLFGLAPWGVRLLEALGFVSIVLAFAVFSRRHVGDWRPGAFGGALAILIHVQCEFWHTGQPESFGGVALAWALVCATVETASMRRQRAAWMAAGGLYAVAALLKPPLGGGLLVSAAFVASHVWRRERRLTRAAEPVVALLLGFAIPILATVAYFAAAGAWSALHETLFVFLPKYSDLTVRGTFVERYYRALLGWGIEFTSAGGIGLVVWLLWRWRAAREVEGALHVLGVVAFQLAGVALQGKFFLYHYGGAFPFLALLAGWGLWKLWTWSRRRMVTALLFAVFLAGLVQTRTTAGDAGYYWSRCRLRQTALFDAERRERILDRLGAPNTWMMRRVARFLSQNTRPDDAVFVWGFDPLIYVFADRRPPTRYIYNVAQRAVWGRDEARSELVQDLAESLPAAIVVEHEDRLILVTGEDQDSAAALESFNGLRAILERDYQLAETVQDFEIHLRK